MLDTIRRGFERFGFLPVETPAFELTKVLLTKSGGETEKQVYFVQSTGSLTQPRQGEASQANRTIGYDKRFLQGEIMTTKRATAPARPKTAGSVLELVGGTPLVRLNRIPKPGGATVLAKLESLNPGGSVKDRIALAMVEDAERRGVLKAGATLVEPTSGNTGIGLAMVCAVRGYRIILTMPDDMSAERQRLLARYGAEIHLTPAIEGMSGAVFAAQEICREHPEYFMPMQFENPANPEAHRRTTALEILDATEDRLDVFVAAVGTGGTVTGVGEVLKDRLPGVRVVGVEAARPWPDTDFLDRGGVDRNHDDIAAGLTRYPAEPQIGQCIAERAVPAGRQHDCQCNHHKDMRPVVFHVVPLHTSQQAKCAPNA